MHTPTLIIIAATLAALVTVVLCAVWYFNRHIAGLRFWVFSFLCTSAFASNLLLRDHIPEVLSVILGQLTIALAGYFCWLGSRAYMGRAAPPHKGAAVLLVALVVVSWYFTHVQPSPGARFVLAGLFAGVCFVLTAFTLAHGGFHRVPARYLFAWVIGAHGIFVLLRPLVFKLVVPPGVGEADTDLVSTLSSIVVMESMLALVLVAFGTIMLINEVITTELRHLAEVDALTGVFNRRAYLTLLDKAISSAQRGQTALSVLIIDLDHFKKINDTLGHATGDDVLRHFVLLASRCLRNEDVMGRLGGEEFAIFLPNAGEAGGLTVAERLRGMVELNPAQIGQHRIALTVSVGVALCAEDETADAVLQRADQSMYLAKERGRNRVEIQPQVFVSGAQAQWPTCPVPAVPAVPGG